MKKVIIWVLAIVVIVGLLMFIMTRKRFLKTSLKKNAEMITPEEGFPSSIPYIPPSKPLPKGVNKTTEDVFKTLDDIKRINEMNRRR